MPSRLVRPATLATLAALLLATVAPRPGAAQSWLDVTSFTDGMHGEFAGTLGGVAVKGGVSVATLAFGLNPIGGEFWETTTDGTSSQFAFAGIYSPASARVDRIGYFRYDNNPGDAAFTFEFADPITNPIFHVANLAGASFDFSLTPGIGLTLLSGNGGGGEGLAVDGLRLVDLDPATHDITAAGDAPPTVGPRSGYGSVRLDGTFTTVTFALDPHVLAAAGAFTLSLAPTTTAPEPATWTLLAAGLVALGGAWARRRHGR